MQSPIVHPRLMREVSTKRFNSLAKIEIAQITQDAQSGEETITYSTDPNYQAIPCQVDPHTEKTEQRKPELTLLINTYDIMLDRYAPDVTIASRVTLQDGTVHNVLDVRSNDIKSHTVLLTEIIS